MPAWKKIATFTNESGGKTMRFVSPHCPGMKVETRRTKKNDRLIHTAHYLIFPDGTEKEFQRFNGAADYAERIWGVR